MAKNDTNQIVVSRCAALHYIMVVFWHVSYKKR